MPLSQQGLSVAEELGFGRAAIREMNRVGVIVDTAHSGWPASLDAGRASERPRVASHSGCCAVNAHIRCKPDEVIRAICDSGGYVGICCVPAFLGGNVPRVAQAALGNTNARSLV